MELIWKVEKGVNLTWQTQLWYRYSFLLWLQTMQVMRRVGLWFTDDNVRCCGPPLSPLVGHRAEICPSVFGRRSLYLHSRHTQGSIHSRYDWSHNQQHDKRHHVTWAQQNHMHVFRKTTLFSSHLTIPQPVNTHIPARCRCSCPAAADRYGATDSGSALGCRTRHIGGSVCGPLGPSGTRGWLLCGAHPAILWASLVEAWENKRHHWNWILNHD